jgi:single-stranded-DNA-specific exonuclease
MPAFLNVERSLTGRRWVGPTDEQTRQAEAIAQIAGVDLNVARVLARRGVAPDNALNFLAPSLRELLPDPMVLRDMGRAADRMLAALRDRQPVAVFADYDVDGGASAALVIRWLRAMGHDATLYIPDRIDEGYGPNIPAIQQLATRHKLIICVDCGTLSHEALAVAAPCDVIVLDHHMGGETLPPVHAVVNPNRQDEDGSLAHLCAAGVVFLWLVECNRRLRAAEVQGPDLMGFLDLVALATVADVAPLVGVNRALVRQGLRVMAHRDRPGLAALADVARLRDAPDTYALGFMLGPRVNAGGRVGRADLGARLLLSDDPLESERLSAELEQLNTDRRAIESAVRDEAMAQAEARGTDGPLVWAAGEGWHPGVIGIVAARLTSTFNRPAVVIALDGGVGKGSGRSVAGVDLGGAIARLTAEGLLLKGGGHPMAAGLTVATDALPAAMERLGDLLARQGAGSLGPRDLMLDGMLLPQALNPALAEALEAAGPYGQGAPAPRFAIPAMLLNARRIGSAHLRVDLRDATGAMAEAVAFNAADGPLGQLVQAPGHMRFHVAGRIALSTWGGRTKAELHLEDAAPAN